MKLIFTMLALSVLLFGSKEDFIHDYNKALELAQAQNKDIYMLISSESCKWCRKFEETTLNDQTTIDMLKKEYVLLVLTRGVDFIPKDLRVKRVPKHFFLTPNGEVIHAFTGYWNSSDFASLTQDVQKKK